VVGRISTDVATTLSIFVGFASNFGADLLADTTQIVPAAIYLNGLIFLQGGTNWRYVSVHNGTVTVNDELQLPLAAATPLSYRLSYRFEAAGIVYANVEVDTAGGQAFTTVRKVGASPIHPAQYESANVYGAFPAAGLNYGVYVKQGAAAHVINWDYTTLAMNRI
jgi:hypothetical protein